MVREHSTAGTGVIRAKLNETWGGGKVWVQAAPYGGIAVKIWRITTGERICNCHIEWERDFQ